MLTFARAREMRLKWPLDGQPGEEESDFSSRV